MIRHFTPKALVEGIFQLLIVPATLFLAAGTMVWPAGWIFLSLFYGFILVSILQLSTSNPGLLVERMSLSKSNQKSWDKIFFPLFLAMFIAWLVLIALDAMRFHWSEMPIWLQGVGGLILAGSFALIYLTLQENSYLSPTVRIQEDRGQTVVSTGPYGYVRHPMYTGILFFSLGTALLLGSWPGLLLSPILIGLIATRAVLEERMLRDELSGYDTYMAKVHYRFIPHVW